MGSPIRLPTQTCSRNTEADRLHALATRSIRIERQANGRVRAASPWLPEQPRHNANERSVQRRSPSDPKYIPDAWPALLSQDVLSAYAGMSKETLGGILTVRPLDLGARCVRYRRTDIDAWLETLPQRGETPASTSPSDSQDSPQSGSRTDDALERVRARTAGRRP
jgi:hypothetical protein